MCNAARASAVKPIDVIYVDASQTDAAYWSWGISAAAILDGSPMRPPAFMSTEEGVSPTTITITPWIFTRFGLLQTAEI